MPALANVIDDLLPAALRTIEQYANDRVECDHGRLKARLRSMRGMKTNRTASGVIGGDAFVQNLRRGHDELGADTAPALRLATADADLKTANRPQPPANRAPARPRCDNATAPSSASTQHRRLDSRRGCRLRDAARLRDVGEHPLVDRVRRP